VLKVELSEVKGRRAISYTFDHHALNTLDRDTLGRIVLITDRHDCTTAEIIRAYRPRWTPENRPLMDGAKPAISASSRDR
jgi:hypothetical protein